MSHKSYYWLKNPFVSELTAGSGYYWIYINEEIFPTQLCWCKFEGSNITFYNSVRDKIGDVLTARKMGHNVYIYSEKVIKPNNSISN